MQQLGRVPSPDPAVLAGQLNQALRRLRREAGVPGSAEHCRGLALNIVGDAFRRLLEGDRAAPASALSHLSTVAWFRDRHLPPATDGRAEIAIVIHLLIEVLGVGAEMCAPAAYVEALRDKAVSRTERAVLQVLLEANGRPFTRSEIRDRLPEESRKTAPAIGQVLVGLRDRGLASARHAPAQGSANAAHYAITDVGREACARAGIVIPPSRSLFELPPKPIDHPEGGPSQGVFVLFAASERRIGRSTAVAHVAYRLAAARSSRVLFLDLDGEHASAKAYLPTAKVCRGFAGLFEDGAPIPRAELREWLEQRLDHSEYMMKPQNLNGHLYHLPFGGDSGAAARLEGACQRAALALRGDGSQVGAHVFFASLFVVLAQRFDFVIVDVPAGETAVTYLAATLLADCLVMCSRPDAEDLTSLGRIRDHFAGARGRAPGKIVPLLLRVPARASKPLAAWVEQRFRPLFADAPVEMALVNDEPSLDMGRSLLVDPVTGIWKDELGSPVPAQIETIAARIRRACEADDEQLRARVDQVTKIAKDESKPVEWRRIANGLLESHSDAGMVAERQGRGHPRTSAKQRPTAGAAAEN